MARGEADFDKFFDDVGEGSVFETVLRGHLWVESELLQSLEAALPFPGVADLDRLSFGHKVSLVAAHGLMKADEQGGFRRLNTLRNRLAHNLGESLTEQDEADVVNALGPRHRAHVEATSVEGPDGAFPNRLRLAVTALCIQLQVDREAYEEAHAKWRASARRLVDVASQGDVTDA